MKNAEIFLVDDDPTFAKIMGKRLNKGGFERIEYFGDGTSCLKAFARGAKPKIVFLDFSMITFNGLDALTRIKMVRKNTKVVMISQLEDQEVAQRCLDAGAEMFLHKDVVAKDFPDELLEIIWPDRGYMLNRNTKKENE